MDALVTGRNVLAIHCHQQSGDQYVDAALIAIVEAPDLATALKRYGQQILGAAESKELARLQTALRQNRKRSIAPAGTPIMSVSERDQGPVHVLIRGNPHAVGDQVEPAVPEVFGTQPPTVRACCNSLGATSGKRLALARWLFADDNPLTRA